MSYSNAHIDGTAALVAPAGLTPFALFAVSTRLRVTLGAWRGIYSALNDGRGRLGLNLRDRLGDVLRQGCRHNWRWQRRDLHNPPELTPTIISELLHARNEEFVNHNVINWILNKCSQLSLIDKLFGQGVRS
jgi:hypothetical protein